MGRLTRYIVGILVLLLSVTTFGAEVKNLEELKQIQSYEELIEILRKNDHIRAADSEETSRWSGADTQDMTTGAITGGMINNYSETNVQVAGVDEADTVKVDGRYIYTRVDTKSIAIIDTKDGMKQVGCINYNDPQLIYNYTVDKMFVDGKYLTVMLSHSEGSFNHSRWDSHIKGYTTMQVYDITDRSNPVLKRSVRVEGSLSEIRKIDHQIYLVTQASIGYFREGEYTQEKVLPSYQDSAADSEMQMIDAKSIRYYDWSRCSDYTLITSFNIDNATKAQVNVLIGGNDEFYMSKNAIYIAAYHYNKDNTYGEEGTSETFITKYNIAGNTVKYAGTGRVSGRLLNQFSMDEYNGYFRMATSGWSKASQQNSNNVYILDKNLNIAGKLEGLAPDESIYSVRFEGDRGYVVTFQQVDPLFVIDLSQPKAPKVLGELKVPGFSQYLHPIGDHLVVGIGRSTKENVIRDENGKEIVTRVVAAGLKLSLFDVTNPKAPVEINHINLGTEGSFSEALETHTAVMADPKRHILAIPVYLQFDNEVKITDDVYAAYFQGAYVFGIENGKLVGKAKLGQVDAATGKYVTGINTIEPGHVCYIGDTMYYIYKGQINAYDIDTFKCKQIIKLK